MTAGTVQHVLPHQELLIALHVELALQPSQQLLLHLNLPFNGLSGASGCNLNCALPLHQSSPHHSHVLQQSRGTRTGAEPLALAVILNPQLPL